MNNNNKRPFGQNEEKSQKQGQNNSFPKQGQPSQKPASHPKQGQAGQQKSNKHEGNSHLNSYMEKDEETE